MTLLGLTLAVGIVIDDAIVVLENIFRHMEEEGRRPFQAAIDGTKEVTLGGRRDVGLADRHLPAGRVHDRLHAALHLSVRLHDGVRGHGVAAGQPDADADAERADLVKTGRRVHRHGEGLPRQVDAAYRRSLEWSLDHRGVIVASQPRGRFPPASSEPHGRPLVPANEDMGEFQLVIDTPEGTSLQGMEKVVLGARRRSCSPSGHRARDADHLRARQPLAHLHPAEAPMPNARVAGEVAADVRRSCWRTRATSRRSSCGRRSAAASRVVSDPGESHRPDLRQLSGYALTLLEGRAGDAVDQRLEGGGEPVESRAARRGRSQRAADLGVRDRRPGARAAPDGQRRGRDLELPREGERYP
jgi:hypothetical protein